jgi:phosphate acetyltransferase
MAKDLMEDVSYFGTMVYKVTLTEWFLVLRILHSILFCHQLYSLLKQNCSQWFPLYFLCFKGTVFRFFGDCAVQILQQRQLAEIAISSADSSLAFEIEPKLLCFPILLDLLGRGQVDFLSHQLRLLRKTS